MKQMEMINMNEMNIPALSVNEFIWVMCETYLSCYKNNIPFSKPKPPFLWGGIGIGKSQAIQEIAENLRQKTGKKVIVIDVRLSMQSPVELQGLLMPGADKKSTEYLPQKTYLFGTARMCSICCFMMNLHLHRRQYRPPRMKSFWTEKSDS